MPQRQQADEPGAKSASEPAAPVLRAKNAQTQAVALLLAGGMCLLPFLLPYNQLFEAEWLAAVLGVAAALAVLATHGISVVSLPVPARWLLAFALFLGAQAVLVHPIYPQVPVLAALYVLYAALLIWLGAQLAAANGIERAATILAVCLLAGSMANAASGMIQFYGLPAVLQDIVAELPHGPAAAYGNIGQSNLYANYLALGGAALLFLWLRGNLRTGYALAAAVLLAWTCALSGSRASLLYALWFALLGLLAGRVQSDPDGRHLRSAAYTLAAVILAAHVAIPWLNAAFGLGDSAKGALERLLPASLEDEPRWQIWRLAWRIFANAPIAGAGIGEFAGAAFRSGLSPGLTQLGNQVWTSPHNLPLQLLAETGALGTFLALAGLCTWCWQAGRRYFATAQPAMWWIITAVGIELIHSAVEFPLWSAHFLGVTALLMGLGTRPSTISRIASRLTWILAAGTCLALALAMAILLRDYVRLLSTRVTGTTVTLANAADAARDAAVMHALTRGLLAPPAEYAIILGAPLDRSQLSDRLKMSERIARHYPTDAIIVRRAAFLAFDGQAAAARRLLAQALYTFPKRCNETIRILAQARASDPGAIEPLLMMARAEPGCT
jgi:O-antigen ligase